jgi:multicomponent K+:H+ antiporter subunit G
VSAPAAAIAVDALAAFLVCVAAFFAVVGSWGLAKLSTFDRRLHGPTKASTMGGGGVLAASIVVSAAAGTATLHELLIGALVFLTAPVSAHMLVRAARASDPPR